MKKIILTFVALFSTLTFAQSVTITTILDGACKRGTMPKVIEIYALGDVDFSQYQLQKQSDNNQYWSTDFDMSIIGRVSDDFVYLIGQGHLPTFNKEFPEIFENVYETDAITMNGNDRIRIVRKSDGAVIDQYGFSRVDGTGQKWEYSQSYSQRKSGNTARGVFKADDWKYAGPNSLEEIGMCFGDERISTVVTLASYTPRIILQATTSKIKGLDIELSNRTVYVNKGEIVKIYGVDGKIIENKDLPSGLYFVVVESGRDTENINIVIP